MQSWKNTKNETEAAVLERTIRSSKNIFYRYMEDNGYKYIQKMSQFLETLNSRKKCSIDLIHRNVSNSEFLSVLYSKPLQQDKNPSSSFETKFVSPSTTYFSPNVISHSLLRKVLKVFQFLPKKLQHAPQRMNKKRLCVVHSIEKKWSKSFNNGIVYNRLGF